jgi:hypothetical protein
MLPASTLPPSATDAPAPAADLRQARLAILAALLADSAPLAPRAVAPPPSADPDAAG